MLKAYADHWALITGASSGIGAEFARQLAARGMHLILCARREQLLTQLAAELHQAHGTKTEIIVADLSNPADPARLLEEVRRRGPTIELLVNNAGFGCVAEIEKTDVPRILEMIRVNIATLTELGLNVDADTTFGLYAPAGVSPAVIDRMNREVNRALASPALVDVITKLGGDVLPLTIPEFVSRQAADRARYGAFIKEAGIKVD